MKLSPRESELLEDANIFEHPVRCQIVELLAEQPMHINALSRALGEERGLVGYHLSTLQEHGFVTSKYKIFFLLEQRGIALRLYTVTDKVAAAKAKSG
ncbi:MAG: winged helix-turn-helix transcriptional regulator [Methanomicrobia archaeon]|nr:winged helix-turn-helix transcriptional regulator [Methanomicrobia archaeon]